MFRKQFNLPHADALKKATRSFSLTERVIFLTFGTIFALSAFFMLLKVNESFLVSVPVAGGELVEGTIGSPRFVNPLLAISDADKDITALVYSGLLKATPDGALVGDLAERFEISEDGKTYTFFLRPDATFHNGTRVTTDDVEFTILKAQDPTLKSPRRANWDGVLIEKVSEQEIRFTLKQPYAPFIENTTLGILPRSIWKNATTDEFSFSEYNILAIGSGPYRVKSVGRDSAGIPNEYVLKSFNDYMLGAPYISTLRIRFYGNENELAQALEQGDIESTSGLSANIIKEFESRGTEVEKAILPRVFGVFLNQNEASIFTNKEVREALDYSIDKEALVLDILSGYGTPINGPIPPKAYTAQEGTTTSAEDRIKGAQKILEDAGWQKNSETGIFEKKTKSGTLTLQFSLATGDALELKRAAAMIQETWEALGADIEVEIYETGDLNQNVIRPRTYNALLFGEIVGRDLDLYPFWHSSQRNDPGLNIALYVNNSVDKLLEEARSTTDRKIQMEKYKEFESIIKEETPSIFLYSPSFLYVIPQKVEKLSLGQLTIPGERFLNVHEWYIETSKVWKIFNRNK